MRVRAEGVARNRAHSLAHVSHLRLESPLLRSLEGGRGDDSGWLMGFPFWFSDVVPISSLVLCPTWACPLG